MPPWDQNTFLTGLNKHFKISVQYSHKDIKCNIISETKLEQNMSPWHQNTFLTGLNDHF